MSLQNAAARCDSIPIKVAIAPFMVRFDVQLRTCFVMTSRGEIEGYDSFRLPDLFKIFSPS